jgi:lipid A 3-O-deacylase
MTMDRNKKIGVFVVILWTVSFLALSGDLWAETDTTLLGKHRYGLAAIYGNTYQPENDIGFVLLNGFVLFDNERLWGTWVPERLRLKAEGNLGSTITPDRKLMASVNLLGLFYLTDSSFKTFRPYIEGGIGAIYTDFQVRGEGLRVNFDPLFGVGTEIKTASGAAYLITLRIQHFSNGSIDHDNVGVDSLTLVLGKFF